MENQRIRISKKMLKDSLIRLLKDKRIQEITISEICLGAQINRTTFYKYYGSQYDLLNDIEKDIFDELELRLSKLGLQEPRPANEGLTQTLTFFEDEREKCLTLINSTDKDFVEKLFQLPVILRLIEDNTPNEFTNEQVKYVQTFLTHGGYAIMRQWANSKNRETPQEMSLLIQKIMLKLLRN